MREQERYKRLEEQELERRRLDQIEYEIQQEARNASIEKAYQATYVA